MSDSLDRRKFMKETAIRASGLAFLPFLEEEIKVSKVVLSKSKPALTFLSPRLKFGVIGINHGHIYSMSNSVIQGGGELHSFYAKEDDLAKDFLTRFPKSKRVTSEEEIYQNSELKLILSAAIPDVRAEIGIKAMLSGKDYLADKPAITTLKQLEEVRKVQKQTGRIFSIAFSERFENRATVKAGELIKAGAIGKVIQTIGLGPHRTSLKTRPEWFFDKKRYGGILTDIASHQFDQFLFFTNSTQAHVVSSQAGNVNHGQYPLFEDFGDVMLKGNGGMGYIRVDWFTPNGLKSWGDGRLTILGTEGYIEIRKNIDITKSDNGNHLYLVNNKEAIYMDCAKEPLPFGQQLVDDVLNRTETAMTQAHCLLAMELALKAQKSAKTI